MTTEVKPETFGIFHGGLLAEGGFLTEEAAQAEVRALMETELEVWGESTMVLTILPLCPEHDDEPASDCRRC